MSLLRLLVVLACSTTLGVYAADPKTTVEFQCSAGRPNGWCAIKDPNKHSYMTDVGPRPQINSDRSQHAGEPERKTWLQLHWKGRKQMRAEILRDSTRSEKALKDVYFH
ncbi:hypothetical protein MJO28_012473 [Puccinia striiformis f. sp. tritici]|uniref:Uncharacterized protein n=1 Tax=Puccinia striiformis f. sp. tritici TaxID=168172 RepID=A0ACC0E188_9BASI|nr:hypothetical protein MJO28_012473 [Puccinia striiformis f. sp. tritici]